MSNGKIVNKFPNDSMGFDIYNPNNWKKFLQEKGYATHSDNFPLIYNVYLWGGKSKVVNLFPGKNNSIFNARID